MVLQERLSWCRGFPERDDSGAARWRLASAAAEPSALVVDRERIRRSVGALQTLWRDHRAVLSALVGDSVSWRRRVERLLEVLKPLAHDGRDPGGAIDALAAVGPPRLIGLATKLIATNPGIQPFVDAVLWTHFLAPDRAVAMLRLAARAAPGILQCLASRGRSSVPILVGFLDAAADADAAGALRLFEVLADRRVFEVAVDGHGARQIDAMVQAIQSAQPFRAALPDERTGAALGDAVLRAFAALPGWPPPHRKRLLRLLVPLVSPALVEQWSAFWRTFAKVELNHRQRVVRGLGKRGAARDLAILRKRGVAAVPLELHRDSFSLLLEAMAALPLERVDEFRHLLAEVDARSKDPLLALATAQFWFAQLGGRSGRALAPHFRSLRTLIASSVHVRKALLPASVRAAGGIRSYTYRSPFVEVIAEEPVGSTECLRAARTFHLVSEALAGSKAAKRMDEWRSVSAIFRLTEGMGESAAAARAFCLWIESRDKRLNGWIAESTMLFAARASAGDAERFPTVLAGVLESGIGRLDHDVLHRLQSHAEITRLIGAVLRAGEGRRALRLAAWAAVVLGARRATGLETRGGLRKIGSEAWMAVYPKALSPALRRLAGAVADPADVARRLLGQDIADPAAIEREIVALESRLRSSAGRDVAALKRRLANLKQRRRAPRLPTPARLERLAAKVDARAAVGEIDRQEAALAETVARLLASSLPGVDWEVLKSDAARMTLIAHVVGLPGEIRKLGLRILARAFGPGPRHLRDDPRNRAFLERLRKRGVEPRPWVEGIGERIIDLPDGGRITLAFESDPLEVMRMGEPFRTCLTPGDFNFFSAVVNAADVNKRVLFARQPDGVVVGRCLFGLTDEGDVVTFNAYAHAGDWGFERLAAEAAAEVAQRMGTRVVPSGKVSPLLAGDWYDDGARDLSRRFEKLARGSAFLAELAKGTVAAGLERLVKSFGPEPLDPTVWELLLADPAFAKNRDWADAALARISDFEGLSEPAFVRLAGALATAGGAWSTHPAALARLRRLVYEGLESGFSFHAFDVAEDWIGAVIESGEAQLVLAHLRSTRRRSVRAFEQETDRHRRFAAALAHEAMHRPEAARRLLAGAAPESDEGRPISAARRALIARLAPPAE